MKLSAHLLAKLCVAGAAVGCGPIYAAQPVYPVVIEPAYSEPEPAYTEPVQEPQYAKPPPSTPRYTPPPTPVVYPDPDPIVPYVDNCPGCGLG